MKGSLAVKAEVWNISPSSERMEWRGPTLETSALKLLTVPANLRYQLS